MIVLGRRGGRFGNFVGVRGAGFFDVGAVDLGRLRFRLVVVLGVVAALLGDQPFAIGDRDLVIVGMDFGEGQEAVAVAAVFHERRLERRFDADDLGEVDVALEGLAARGFEVEFLEAGSIDDDHAGLFGMAGVYQHAAGHGLALPEAMGGSRCERPAALPPLLSEGSGAPSTRRTAKHSAKTGKHRVAGPRQGPATSSFLIVTACLTIPRALPSAGASGGDCRRSATPKGRYERRRLLAERNIRCLTGLANQKIEVEEIAISC